MQQFRRRFGAIRKQARRFIQAWRHAGDLTPVQDNTRFIADDAVLLFCRARNEGGRLPYWLDYHRAMGVGHVLLVDNGSTDETRDVVRARDVSVWHTTASYKAAHYGTHWSNYLLNRFGHGHWCLTLDPDEFLVYPFLESQSLFDLCSFLERTGAQSLYCRMIDMYADCPVSEARVTAGQNPLEVCQWFDPTGYDIEPNWKGEGLRGGPRSRMFFAADRSRAPYLVKIPLIRWCRGYAYVTSTHRAVPYRLNFYDSRVPTGALLHFKLTADFARKVAEENVRREYAGNFHMTYAAHGDPALINFWHSGSARYTGWQCLEAAGLIQRGAWI